ncbi:MAG TPA: hypothetical protein VJ438_03245 [Candidatus Nanoarchaeia archaeon]|nr:hypothetical protein [Candidatus Nanoarchaeia archaeon]
MDKFKEILKYVFLISIVWCIVGGLIVFHFSKNVEVKNLQIKTLGVVIGELTKSPCMEQERKVNE